MPDVPDRPVSSSAIGGPLASEIAATDVGAPTTELLGLEEKTVSPGRLVWRRFLRHRLAVASGIILLVIGMAVLFAGAISPFGFAEQHLNHRLEGPSGEFWLGTDSLGRDQFTRILYGGRVSLTVGFAVALSSAILGTLIGAIAGYYGGRLDNFLMRVTDLFLSIPLLVILIVAAQILGGRIFDIVIILSLFFWMPVARIVRGKFLSLKEKEFVEAARSIGASNRRIILRHILPNTMGPIIVNATISVGTAILTESVLSFLGFGIQPPTPTWGNMISQSKGFTATAPYLVGFPGLMILITVLCVNFLGDGLRDALDPTQQRMRA